MFLSRSTGRKIVATATAAVTFVLLYEVTMLDSRYAARQAEVRDGVGLVTGTRLRFTATAYCKGTTTASGVNVRTGIAAADPDILPVGSVIQVDRLGDRYNGIYTVMDTGPEVQGRHVDIYMWSCHEALALGRRAMQVQVLRLGWNPNASTPALGRSAVQTARIRRWSGRQRTATCRAAAGHPTAGRVAHAGRREQITTRYDGRADAAVSGRRLLLFPVLQLIQLEVDAALRQQLLVGARFAQLALVQDEDLVHVLDGRQPVRDGDRRAACHQDVQRVPDQHLGLGVDARRRLVEDQDPPDRRRARARTTAAASARPRASRRARRPGCRSPAAARR